MIIPLIIPRAAPVKAAPAYDELLLVRMVRSPGNR
jgi:hypothetical protein